MNRSLAASLLLLTLCSCHTQVTSPQPVPMPVPTPATQQSYENKDAGIAFMYPSGWATITGSKSQLDIEASDKSKGHSRLTLDVPTLPFHIPGMIPIDAVTNGFIDDAKKKIPDQTVTRLPDTTLPDAKQHRVKLAGHENGKSTSEEAVLIVHNDKVYILTAEGDDAGFSAAHAALDTAVKSLQWIK